MNDILCLIDPDRGCALVTLQDNRLAVLTASPEVAIGINAILDKLNVEGAPVRVESLAPDAIGVDSRVVRADDPLFLAGVADFFRGRGYGAEFLEPLRARAWYLLRTLPLDKEMSEALLRSLKSLPDEELTGLLKELEDAAAALLDIDARTAARLAEIEAKDAAIRKELGEQSQKPTQG